MLLALNKPQNFKDKISTKKSKCTLCAFEIHS